MDEIYKLQTTFDKRNGASTKTVSVILQKIARLFFMTQDIERDLPSSIGVLCLQISSEDLQWLNEFQQQFLL